MDNESQRSRRISFHFVTLFPETIHPWLQTSIIGRALKSGLFDYSAYQLRDFSTNKHKSVDDTPYGGGGGMLLSIEPLVAAVESIKSKLDNPLVVYFSPAGKTLNQDLVTSFDDRSTDFILVCGHYEGVDQRFIDHWVDLEVSLGDFVLTGGEIPALAFCDAIIRRQKGTLATDNAPKKESFSLKYSENQKPVLEYAQYTKPRVFREFSIPEVLAGGHHRAIEDWQKQNALERTQTHRPDLLDINE